MEKVFVSNKCQKRGSRSGLTVMDGSYQKNLKCIYEGSELVALFEFMIGTSGKQGELKIWMTHNPGLRKNRLSGNPGL